jgi:hypothetical protein
MNREESLRQQQINQKAIVYQVPLDLAEIMSDEVLRLAEEYIQQEFPSSPDLREARRQRDEHRHRDLMIVGLKYVTEARSTSEQERAAWRAFWEKWDATHLTWAERIEQSRRQHDSSGGRLRNPDGERLRDSEMREARDAFLEED